MASTTIQNTKIFKFTLELNIMGICNAQKDGNFGASLTQTDGRGFDPRVRQYSFVETGPEMLGICQLQALYVHLVLVNRLGKCG